MKFKWWRKNKLPAVADSSEVSVPTISVDDMVSAIGPTQVTNFDGSKFFGGFGATELQTVDYWTLRARSSQLFNENLYARGLIRRLVTNEINTGLVPESMPSEEILGLEPDSLNEWSENVETRFKLYNDTALVCDYEERSTLDAIQRAARLESIVGGDVLVLQSQSKFGIPNTRLINGSAVRSPYNDDHKLKKGHKIVEGIEIDSKGRHVAFYVVVDDLGKTQRIMARGAKTGRLKAWLVYGTDKRHSDVRGQPLLSLVLQSLKEVDRYRDASTRKAVLNSILAMFIQKDENKPGTKPLSGGAVRKDTASIQDSGGGAPRQFNIADYIPGLVIDELQVGEKPVAFDGKGDVVFGVFEEAIIQSVAWANEMPPEILRLAFSNNYSASQAAINEFKIYLNLIRSRFASEFCKPIYNDWLLSEVLLGKIEAPGMLEAWRDPLQYEVFAAWVASDWTGAIKPSTDIKKQGQGYQLLVDGGWITNDRASRELTGTKFSKNIKRIKRENEMKVEAMAPLREAEKQQAAAMGTPTALNTTEILNAVDGLSDRLDDISENTVH